MLPPLGLTAVLAGAAAVALALGSQLGLPGGPDRSGPAAASAAAQWVAAPDGRGAACTRTAPCSPEGALAKAGPGDAVVLQQGEYPVLKAARTAAGVTPATPVVVRPEERVRVTLAGLSVIAPGVTVEGVRVTGTVYVNPSAVGTTLRDMHVTGAGVFLRADGTRLLDSVVEGGDSIDGVQIKDGRGILVQGSTIRGFNQLTGKLHADCVQIFDSQDVTLRANTIHDCDNAGIIFSGGGGKGIRDVLVESNFITGCRVKSEACKGGTAIDLREPKAVGVVVRQNTFAGGSVRIDSLPGLVVDRNVFGYLSSCKTPMTNSVVWKWNTGLCRTPTAVGKDGNRQGSPQYVGLDAVDLHVSVEQRHGVTVTPVQVALPAGLPAARDIDGQEFSPTTAGADEPGTAPVVPGATPTAPVVAPLPSPSLVVSLAPEGSVRSGVTRVTATVAGGTATALSFQAAGTTFARGASADGGRTWTAAVDSRKLPNGTYAVRAVAVDAQGRTSASAAVSTEVRN